MFQKIARIAALALLTSSLLPRALAQQTSVSPETGTPVEVTDDEIESHRVGKLEPIAIPMTDMTGEMRAGMPLPLKVIVDKDGQVVSVDLLDEVNLDDPDSMIPPKTRTQIKKVIGRAEDEVRALHYRPFEKNGQAVSATFEEEVPIVPEEMRPTKHVEFPEVRDWNSLRMTLARTGCFGTCPSYSIEVHGDGTVLYESNGYTAIHGNHRGKVSKEAVAQMLDAFQRANYFSLANEYKALVTDNPTYTTSIKFDSHFKKIVDYVGLSVGMPAVVQQLEDAVDELSDSARWTKGDSATVGSLVDEKWNFHSNDAADTFARVVMYGSAEAVHGFISNGVPLDGNDGMNGTPLDRAAFRGNTEMLHDLLKAGAGSDMSRVSAALSRSASAGKLDAVRLLFQYGADPNGRPASFDPPLIEAAFSGVPSVVQEVLSHRPNLSIRGGKGATALISAVDSYYPYEHKDKDRAETVRLLLDAGAEVDARDDEGNTALLANGFDVKVASLLIEHGADVNARNNRGWTPLFNASSAELVRFLLQHGASLSIRDNDGKTALENARQYGNPETVALLESAQNGKVK